MTAAPSPLKILHVLGSPTDDWSFNVSMLYGGAFDKTLGNGKYVSAYVIVRPHGRWSFVEDLSNVTATGNACDEEFMDITAALTHIKNVIKPDAVLMHLQCTKGNTVYRALFEVLEIPLVGGDSESRFISFDKIKTRHCVSGTVRCPDGIICRKGDKIEADKLAYPCIVKSSRGDDSLGVRLVQHPSLLNEAIENALHYSDKFIIERFIRGREIRTGVIKSTASGECRALSCLEYKVDCDGIRHTELKLALTNGLPTGCTPANAKSWFLGPSRESNLIHRIQEESIKAFQALGLEDFGLFDFRVDEEGTPWFLECNIFCSFSPKSKLNILAKNSGMSDEELFDLMMKNTLLRNDKPLPEHLQD